MLGTGRIELAIMSLTVAPLGSAVVWSVHLNEIESKTRTTGHSVGFHRWETTGTKSRIHSATVWPLISSRH